jgi:hypothetical protein
MATPPLGDREPLGRRGRDLHELLGGRGHQAGAQVRDELGAGLGSRRGAEGPDDLEELGEARVLDPLARGGGLDQGVELVGASSRREHGAHRSCPVVVSEVWWSVPWWPDTCLNDRSTGRVTGCDARFINRSGTAR